MFMFFLVNTKKNILNKFNPIGKPFLLYKNVFFLYKSKNPLYLCKVLIKGCFYKAEIIPIEPRTGNCFIKIM